MVYKPSIIAIACVLCARKVSKIVPEWNTALEDIVDYKFSAEIKACSEKLYKAYERQFVK